MENYNRPSRTIQCYKCKHYHHTSHKCKIPCCIKCGGDRESKVFPKGTEKLENPICVNCSGPHVVTVRVCPKFPENSKKSFSSTIVTSSVSYANMLKPPVLDPHPTISHIPAPSTSTVLNSLSEHSNMKPPKN